MRQAFVDTLTKLMRKDKRLITITADMGFSVFEKMQKEFPLRFINSGATEQASVGIATGLSQSGFKVFLYSQAVFITMRCYEQVRLDISYNNVDVKLIGTAAGLSLNQLGISHFALEDIALMRLLPNMTIFTPGDPIEMQWAVNKAYEIKGPVYFRITKNGSQKIHSRPLNIKIGEVIKLTNGTKGTLFVSGGLLETALRVSQILKNKKTPINIFSIPTINPLDRNRVIRELKKTDNIFSLEEHYETGGLGSILAELIAKESLAKKFYAFGIPHKFINRAGSYQYLLEHECGLSADNIANKIYSFIS